MRVRFKGEADRLPCEAFGQTFEPGEWVEVEGMAAKKLPGNPMFETENSGGPFDHDSDGKAGGSEKPEGDLSALRADYTAVVGKKPFPGWDAVTLQAKIDAALAADPVTAPEPDPEEQDA